MYVIFNYRDSRVVGVVMSKLKQFNKKLGNGVKNCFVFLKNKTKYFLSVIKKWFNRRKKHEKFIIGGVSLATLLTIVICCFTIDFSRILGNVYSVEDIGANIDDIHVGDRIDYTGNGFNDWQVLSINKEDNTIDIVASSTPEQMAITCELGSCNNFYDTLQRTADKYLDNKYAVSARSVTADDLKKFTADDKFWIAKKSDTSLFYNKGSATFLDEESDVLGYFVPVVNLNVDNASSLNIGDIYNVTINDINEWFVVRVNDSTIDIVPKKAPILKLDVTKSGVDFTGIVNFERNKYDVENVNYVSTLYSDYIRVLNSINYRQYNPDYFFWSYHSDRDSEAGSNDYNGIETTWVLYYVEYYEGGSSTISTGTDSMTYSIYTYLTGFRPVVTLKYSDEEKDGKEKNTELEIGDYVKYSSNAYSNWRVLDIDKENKTVDIISGGIVKNISLEGKEDYEQLSTILQKEVDKYKAGDDVVNARPLEIDDLDNLKRMKDNLSAKYFLNNKTKYRPRNSNDGTYSDYISYVVGVAYYDSSVSQINNDWAILEYENEINMYDSLVGAYKYTAGLRPIITLKLSEVEEVSGPDSSISTDKTNDSLEEKQEEANKEAQTVIKDVEIIEESIIKDSQSSSNLVIDNEKDTQNVQSGTIKYIVNNGLQDKVYQEFINFILIIILLTIIAFSLEKIKNCIKKCNKRMLGIVACIILASVIFISIFNLNLPFSKIRGSVYEIDDVQVGDTFNYTANGYSDWEVLSIDRENKTLEIVSKNSVEDLAISCYDTECSDYYNVLQETANKYINGEYVIGARNITEEDELRYYNDGDKPIWLSKQEDNKLYYRYYNHDKEVYSDSYLWASDDWNYGYIVPVVTLNVSDSSLYTGKRYTYSLNGINDWVILYKDSSTISIIPRSPKEADLRTNRNGTNIQSYVASEIEKYKDDNVVSVRSISADDISALDSIGYYKDYHLLTGKFIEKTTSESDYQRYSVKNNYYYNEVIYYGRKRLNSYSYTYYNYTGKTGYNARSYVAGFRPVIKIKYKDNDNLGKALGSDIEIGDYVKYSANGYKSWKVLNINKEKGTVDIISAGSVKNLTLKGKETYDNYETILQAEVDKYKVGDSAVNARVVEHSDFDSLSKIKETPSRFILGNKIKYRDEGVGSSNCKYDSYGVRTCNDSIAMVYAFGIGYYNTKISSMDYDWAWLEAEAVDEYTYKNIIGSYEYTAGLRPIITLKLSEVEKEEDSEKVEEGATKKDEEIEEEQNKLNNSDKTHKPVNNKKIKKENIIYIKSFLEERTVDSSSNSGVNNNNSVDKTEIESELAEEIIINENSNKRKMVLGLIISSIVLLTLAIVLKLIKFKVLNKKDFRVK